MVKRVSYQTYTFISWTLTVFLQIYYTTNCKKKNKKDDTSVVVRTLKILQKYTPYYCEMTWLNKVKLMFNQSGLNIWLDDDNLWEILWTIIHVKQRWGSFSILQLHQLKDDMGAVYLIVPVPASSIHHILFNRI